MKQSSCLIANIDLENLNNRTTEVFKRIKEGWKQDAKSEAASHYFYFYDEVDEILQGSKYFVIGRKGSGKTAICQHIIDKKESQIFAIKLSFKNFPFNILYKLSNNAYTYPNQYITIWKYLIYCKICGLMVENNSLPLDVHEKLYSLFPQKSIESLSKEIGKWTAKDFGIEVLGCGFNIGGDRNPIREQSWIDRVEILENFIIENIDDESSYYIIFDELDEDYRDDYADKNYLVLLTSLFKAIQGIKDTFAPQGKKVLPLVFLRDDIFNKITDSDKNKWNDNTITLNWNLEKIKKLIGYRLSKDFESDIDDFKILWDILTVNRKINFGRNNSKHCPTFDYMAQSTLLRPRDFVQFIKMCAVETLKRNQNKISNSIIKFADREFSNYFKGEFKDEIAPQIPAIDEVFDILAHHHKMTIPQDEFRTEIQNLIEKGIISNLTVDQILKMLFEFSVIGNVPNTKKGNPLTKPTQRDQRQYFKYTHSNMTLNNKEPLIIHRGLFKALHLV